MDGVFRVYSNDIGISFRWQKNAVSIQVIFRDIGFLLSVFELDNFLYHVLEAKDKEVCLGCTFGKDCRSMLLKTPFSPVSIAVSLNELHQIEDLLRGTLFQLELEKYLHEVCKN